MKTATKWIVLGVIGTLALILLGGGCSAYNGMVTAEADLNMSWDNVQNQYQRRFDLFDNLVNSVKGAAAHESNTLQAVTDARAGVSRASAEVQNLEQANADTPVNVARYQAAQDNLSRAFNVYVNAVTEAYPDLKANQNFLALQDEIAGTENRIATERTRYNKAVREYNLKIRRFPNNIFAGIFGFSTRDGFEAEAAAQSAPRIQF